MGIFSKFFSGSEGEEQPGSEHADQSEAPGKGQPMRAKDELEFAAGTVDEPPLEPAAATPSERTIDPRLASPPPMAARPTPSVGGSEHGGLQSRRTGSAGGPSGAKAATHAAPPPAPSTTARRPAATPPSRASTEKGAVPSAPIVADSEPVGSAGKALRRMKRPSTANEIDGAFASLEAGEGLAVHDEEAEVAATEAARQAFREISSWYVSHVRNLMLEVKWGSLSSSWLLGCERSIQSLTRLAREMRWPELADALTAFSRQASSARRAGANVTGEAREQLLAAYEPLIELMPQAFALGAERERREPIIVRSLLLQVPEVETVEIERLMAAGMSTLESLLSASPDEVAVTSGIPETVARRIVEHLHTYKSGSDTTVSAPEPSAQLRELRELIGKLEKLQERFEEAASSWENGVRERKRELRDQRERAMLSVNIALARLGEVDRIDAISQLPFADRIGQLGSYLREAEDQEKALNR